MIPYFKITPMPTRSLCEGVLLYLRNEYSFSFKYDDPTRCRPCAYLCFGPLQIDVNCDSGQLFGVSGYVGPSRQAQGAVCIPSHHASTGLVVAGPESMKRGVAYTLGTPGITHVTFDYSSGWACLGSVLSDSSTIYEFAPGCFGVIWNEQLTALWLHPRFQ